MNEKKLRKFKLIDREGFLKSHHFNYVILQTLSVGCVLKGYVDENGDLVTMCGMVIVFAEELKYFAEMVELPEELQEGAVINEFRCLQNKQEGE